MLKLSYDVNMSKLSEDNIDQQNNIPNHSNFVDDNKLLQICNKKPLDDSKCHKILNMTATNNTMKHTNNNTSDLSKQNKHLVGKEQICNCLPEKPIQRDDLKTTISIFIRTSEDENFKHIKNHTCSKNIDLPSTVTDPNLIEAQAQNKISESEIKRGIKRDHLTQQLNNPISNTTIPEIEECAIKKPKIEHFDSDMDISSDDEKLEIIETPDYYSPSLIKLPQERENDVSKPDIQSRELAYCQIPSASKQLPKIMTSSTPLKMNNESCSTYDSSKDPLNVNSEHIVINNVVALVDPRLIHTPNNESTRSIYDANYQADGLSVIPGYVNQSPDEKPETIDPDVEEIFRKLTEILETPPEYYEENVTKSQNQLILNQNQKNLKQPSVEPSLSVPHNAEASSKSSMNVLCGDSRGKIMSNDVKNNSLGVQLGMSSNINNTLKINKTSNELMPMVTIKSKAEDPNLRRKKFELSDTVVKLLSQYYSNNRFKSKELFKFMAREMVHKLLNTIVHPEEHVIEILIRNMFSDEQIIQIESEDQIVKLLSIIL